MPLPAAPLKVQRVIADFLDRKTAAIDALIQKKERLIELLQEKRQALITQAVTRGLDPRVPMKDSGIEWLGEIPAHWEAYALRYVLDSIEQGWSPSCENRPADETEWGVLKAGCVNGSEFNEMEQKALPADLEPRPQLEIRPGDLLMSRANTRELLGSTTLVRACRARLMLCDKLYRLRYKKRLVNAEFLELLLSSRPARYQMERDATGTSSSMQNIGQDTVRRLILPWPPVEEQASIAVHIREKLQVLDDLSERLMRSAALLREYRQALITAAVTGQIDIPQEPA